MKYSDLTPEIKEAINAAYTQLVNEAFKPLLKIDAVNKLYEIIPRKQPLLNTLGKQFNLPAPLISSVVVSNLVYANCKKEIVAKRNAIIVEEFKNGSSVAELSQRYGVSKQFIELALKPQPRFHKKSAWSYASVLDVLKLSSVEHSYEPITKKPETSRNKKSNGYSFAKILADINSAKTSQKQKVVKKGHSDFLKLRRSK